MKGHRSAHCPGRRGKQWVKGCVCNYGSGWYGRNSKIRKRIDNEPGTGGCTSDMLGLESSLLGGKGQIQGAKDWAIFGQVC